MVLNIWPNFLLPPPLPLCPACLGTLYNTNPKNFVLNFYTKKILPKFTVRILPPPLLLCPASLKTPPKNNIIPNFAKLLHNILLLFVALLCLYFFLCKLELFWAWPSYTRIPTNQISYSYSVLKHMRHLHYVRVGCCYWSYTDSRIFSIFQYQPLRKYHPIAKTVSPVRAELRFEFYRSRCLGSQVSPSLFLRNR